MAATLPAREGGVVRDVREVSPPTSNVRTRVHEYGGGEFAIGRGRAFFVDDQEGRIFSVALEGGAAAPLSRAGARYADLVVSPDDRWLVGVEERGRDAGEAENRLVAFAIEEHHADGRRGVTAPVVVAAGHDFYASPTFSGDREAGARSDSSASQIASRGSCELAFLAWDHPNMPWNGTLLKSIAWSSAGPREAERLRGGGPAVSIFQPRYAVDGSLIAISDESGWWNLWRFGPGETRALHTVSAELGRPQWVFGMSSWDFAGDRSALVSVTRAGVDGFSRFDFETGAEALRPTDFVSIGGVEVAEGYLAFIGGTSTSAASLYLSPLAKDDFRCVRAGSTLELSPTMLSRAEARCIELPDGRQTHAFFFAPTSDSARGPADERPPLLVKSHGGPTAATSSALDPRIQFWTSRGFAVADVNYGGSSGYGRGYRDLLERAWGLIDVEDCEAVARTLAAEAFVDPARLAISGGSAGGFTTLCALTFGSTFSAGASHYGIGDLEALVRDTHKFESRYTDWLVGVWPEERAVYEARSPIHHAERLACPVIFFQGLEDRVVPPGQAQAMVDVLAKRGIAHAYVPFEGEQHGFRRAENIRTALDGELYFYASLFGFDAPQPDGVRIIAGRTA